MKTLLFICVVLLFLTVDIFGQALTHDATHTLPGLNAVTANVGTLTVTNTVNVQTYITNSAGALLIGGGGALGSTSMPGITTMGNLVVTGSITNNGATTSLHFAGRGSPTIATNAGAGAGIINATATLDATANDSAMVVTVTAGTTPSTSANIFTVTFGTPYLNNNPPHVVFCPANSAAAILSGTTMVFVGTTTTNGFTFSSGTAALTASIAYKWQVMVIQ